MTISFTLQDPAPSATQVSPRPFIRMSLVSDDPASPVLAPNVNVSVAGVEALVAGKAAPKWKATIVSNAGFGIDISLRFDEPFPDGHDIDVKVVVGSFTQDWLFTTDDNSGPVLRLITPVPGSDGASTMPTIEFDISDLGPNGDVGGSGILQRKLKDSGTGDLDGSQLTCETIDFRGTTNRLVIVDGTPMFVVSEIGPHIVVVSGSGGLTGVPVELYYPFGIDVWINTAQIIKSGEVQTGLGWNVTLTQVDSIKWRVNAVRTGAAFVDGDEIKVSIKAVDGATVPHFADLGFSFFVGDVTAPHVENVTPVAGSRGLSTATGTHQLFDILDAGSGVDSATLNVVVDGVAAITGGVAQADWLASTITPITDGFTVELIKGSTWPSNKEVMFEVTAADVDGNAMGRLVWLQHFGTAQDSVTMNNAGGQLVDDNVVRILSFDLAETSFARPEDLMHTGYAFDGFWYDRGFKNTNITKATWWSEGASANRSAQQNFPVSGYIAVTPGSWSIMEATGAMWMRCSALGAGTAGDWSMAGGVSQALADGDFGREAVLFLAAGPGFIIVDFIEDQAFRINSGGRTPSVNTIASRNGNQAGGVTDNDFKLSDIGTSFAFVSGSSWQDDDVKRSWVVAGVRSSQMEIAAGLSDEFKAALQSVRSITGDIDRKTVLLPIAASSVWHRIRLDLGDIEEISPVLLAHDQEFAVADWINVLVNLEGLIGSLNASSTPAIPAENISACEQVFGDDWLVAVGLQTQVVILALQKNITLSTVVKTLSLVDLGLSAMAGTNKRVSSLAIERSFQTALGHLYTAGVSDSDAIVTRYRHQRAGASSTGQLVTIGTQQFTSLAVIGSSDLSMERFVRAAMIWE